MARETKTPVARLLWSPGPTIGTGEEEIARIAGLQEGVITHEQLLAAGLAKSTISYRVKTGRLCARYRGVYLLASGPARPGPFSEEMAAVLSCRGHGVLSHGSAAFGWGLVETRPEEVMVTVGGIHRHSQPGLRIHRTPALDRRDLRIHHRLPLTAPGRTLIDLASNSSPAQLEDALSAAFALGVITAAELHAALERSPRRHGAPRLRRLLELEGESGFARSTAERRLRALLRAADLPLPSVNAPLHGFVVDFLWPDANLVLEVDGYDFHGDRAAFERDRRRDQVLTAAGYRVIRVTWRQLRDEPMAVVARLARALMWVHGLAA